MSAKTARYPGVQAMSLDLDGLYHQPHEAGQRATLTHPWAQTHLSEQQTRGDAVSGRRHVMGTEKAQDAVLQESSIGRKAGG